MIEAKKEKLAPLGGANLLGGNNLLKRMAEPTGFEPATSDVTGRRSNQLNYDSALTLISKVRQP